MIIKDDVKANMRVGTLKGEPVSPGVVKGCHPYSMCVNGSSRNYLPLNYVLG